MAELGANEFDAPPIDLANLLRTSKTSLPYVRDMSYIEKNKKPEQIPLIQVEALADVVGTIIGKGLMSRDDAKYFLANTLVEGRGDFGVNMANMKGMDKIHALETSVINSLGIIKENLYTAEEVVGTPRVPAAEPGYSNRVGFSVEPKQEKEMINRGTVINNIRKNYPEGNIPEIYKYNTKIDRELLYSRAHALGAVQAFLGKMAENPKATAERLVQRWNGAGPDSKRHLDRVLTVDVLQSGPNKEVFDVYNERLDKVIKAMQGSKKA